MKINRLETHDRLNFFINDQSKTIVQGAEDCLKKNPDSIFYQSRSPYVYLFAHPRTADDGVTKKMYWQPRLLKPPAQTNSYLFRAISNTDLIYVCWLLPPRELWDQYRKNNVTESNDVTWSIDMYLNHRLKLEEDDPQDLSEEKCQKIMEELISIKRTDKLMNRVYEKNLDNDFITETNF